jgi:NAD(P)H-hydrate repair Nnr-like enzyme with NAD(P)H-hydrate dehydratase domain
MRKTWPAVSAPVDGLSAAAAAAVAHGRAAELVPHRAGLVASDLLDAIPLALEA